MIGIASIVFLKAQSAYARAYSLKQLDDMPDITWAASDTISELQRQFVEDGNHRLVSLTRRSDKIALSPDGKDIFIVRNHHAYDVADGFMELNEPPKPGHGYATEVINCFCWRSDGSSWCKIPLPRNGHVDHIRFEGDRCLLQIRNTTTGRIVTFGGSASSVRRLAAIGISAGAHNDDDLWRQLEEVIRQQPEADE